MKFASKDKVDYIEEVKRQVGQDSKNEEKKEENEEIQAKNISVKQEENIRELKEN